MLPRPPHLTSLLSLALAAGLQAQDPPAPQPATAVAAVVAPAQEQPPASGPRISLAVDHQDIEVTLLEFAKRSGLNLTVPELPTQLISVQFKDLPFEEALQQILAAANLDYRKVGAGYVVGLPLDLKLKFPAPDEHDLDATYRCRRVGAASLVDTLSKALPPEVKLTVGPVFLSPPLDNGGGSGDNQVKVLSATDVSFKTHDILISGPAPLVRRALALAQKFDRPRKMVRIAIKIVTLSDTASKQIGVTWPSEVTFSASEQPSSGSGTTGALVNGIRLGSFSHTPTVVSATLNALEQSGKAKTLSNPTLMLLDGERAFILSGQKIMLPAYKGKDQNGQSIYDTSETKVGIYLQVGVQVGLDNDMVLSLYPQVTSIQGYNTINGAEYPTLNTSEEHTTVRASSGEVIVLGGMLRDSLNKAKSGLPLLGHVPLLGKLFATDNDSKDKEELMIILTPELVDETLPKTDVKISVTNPAP